MELMQGARDMAHQRLIRDFLRQFAFELLPLTENIGHRAAVYVDEYALSRGLRAADAVIAATATEAGLPLLSGNVKHFAPVQGLDFHAFHPD
jgi:predicted nucleic acid-binding protein